MSERARSSGWSVRPGGGKSVLMRTIIGLIRERSGEIEVMGGRNRTRVQERSTQSAVSGGGNRIQQGALFYSLTVRQNIQFPLRDISFCQMR